jgi:CBS domain containing-hemolysin-like protein
MSLFVVIPVIVFLIVLKGFFSGSEIALVSADRLKLGHLAKQGSEGARRVMEALQRPERILATTLVGTNITTVVITTLATLLMVRLFGMDAGEIYATLLFTPLLLVFGEIVPKSVFQQKADAIAPVAIFALRAFQILFWPIVILFSTIAAAAAKRVGRRRAASHLFPARDQLRHLIDMASRASETQVFDSFRIERAIRFADTTVGEEMVPVGEVVGLESTASTEEAIDIVRRKGYSRLPVFEGHEANIVGVATLRTWDLLDPDTAGRPLSDFTQPARYLSPLQTLDEVRPLLRARPDQMAIVVDEFGSAVGMITLQDVMAAVVGPIEMGFEFEDFLPRQAPGWQELGEDVYLIDGRLPISELNDLLGLHLPSAEFLTVGGLVTSSLRGA